MNLLVTAGPTRERLDPVRYLSNRSTGKMGFAVAAAGAAAGHSTTLIAGPVALRTPPGVRRLNVESAADMEEAVRAEFPRCDALVMAAAVADWRPSRPADHKLKKHPGRWTVEMERTVDILEQLKPVKGSRLIVGFAAETQHLLEEATRKRRDKDLDLIVGNDIAEPGSGFGVDTNRVVLVGRDDSPEWWPLLPKADVARRLIQRVEALLHAS
jgi:phosphopantothenoylcysteine decarboxylase / phosphopantothenate---cysteine ligase